MDRPTKEVVLPISGIKAQIFTYYLRGEKKEIEAVMLESAEFEQDPETGTPKFKRVDTTYRARMEDKAVLLAIKSLTDSENKSLPIETKTLDELPDDDFETLRSALPSSQPKKK